ncbi:MAG TPA: M56 family metallopeptidase [Bacteroides sp.]|nr:M56 family metallopeptidase [Bacteroides sp.]
MTRFIIYLFETGLCLSLLYLAYWLFLRRETYFNFNRVYLVGSILLALSVPLLHLNFIIPMGSSLQDPAEGIVKFRDYYEEMILLSDADFGAEPGISPGLSTGGTYPPDRESETIQVSNAGSRGHVSPARILLIIYIGGVMYFFIRFMYLVIRLYLLALRNGVTRQEGFRMVEIKEDISPFSFFRFLFINNQSFNESELNNVLEHEKAHIRQKHSMDHLFAHGLAVFQWFNPFAWQMRNALKTTHEYIADRQVIDGGIEMFDYQSLLLKQVIGYHSVELVNNFNLKPIKKRIAMMSKKRSGMPARMKAMLVIPFAIAIFLLFADFTLKGPGNRMFDVRSELTEKSIQSKFGGLWIKQSKDDFSDLLLFRDDKFSFSEGAEIREYFWRMENSELILSQRRESGGTSLKVDNSGDELMIWWNDSHSSKYKKSGVDNTMDLFLNKQDVRVELPWISQFRLMEKQSLVFKICLGYTASGSPALTFNGKLAVLEGIPSLVEQERNKHSKIEVKTLTAMFFIDKQMPMEEVVKVREVLREINSLKVADAGYPEGDLSVSPLQYHTVGLPRLLPPKDAKLLDKSEVEKKGIKLFVIDLSAKNTSPKDMDKKLEQFIRDNEKGKYVFSLEYGKDIPYGQYIESVNIVWNVVYRFRKEMALKRFEVPYAQLGNELQKEIKKIYPMVLSEAWSGN